MELIAKTAKNYAKYLFIVCLMMDVVGHRRHDYEIFPPSKLKNVSADYSIPCYFPGKVELTSSDLCIFKQKFKSNAKNIPSGGGRAVTRFA